MGTGVVALLALIAPGMPDWANLWESVFPKSPVVMDVAPSQSSCESSWIVPRKSSHLVDTVREWRADERQVARWQRENGLAYAKTSEAFVSLRGNTDHAVEIRDISISVTRRSQPLRGSFILGGGCGAGEEIEAPQVLAIGLDTLPLNQRVPVRYLLNSDQQKSARATAADKGEPITLPQRVTTDDYYSFTLIGLSEKYDCDWSATIEWWDGEETRTETVDNQGRPFRVSSTQNAVEAKL